jgi:hypothetical protein
MIIMTFRFFPNDKGNPPGKLADVEIHFENLEPESRGLAVGVKTQLNVFAGLKLIGFSIWARKDGSRSVTFPARQYAVNGERRSFALLRPTTDSASQDIIRDVILDAYAEHEAERAATV